MAPFKFGKKNKSKKDEIHPVELNSNIKTESSSSSSHTDTPKLNYLKPSLNASSFHNAQRVAISPVENRSMSTQSTLHQSTFTPWSRHRLEKSPFPRYRHAASSYCTDQGEILVYGGLHDQSVYGDTWIIKSLDNRENGTRFQSTTVPITEYTPPPRVGHASTLCGNAFVIFGGDTHKVNEAGMMDDDLYLFNINSHKWTIPQPQGTRPLGRYGHKISIIATTQMKTKLYVFGGQFDDTYFNDLAVFDLSSFRRPDSHWEFIKPVSFVPPPLTNHTMVSYDHKLWVFGGDTPHGLNNKVFMFDPVENEWSVIQTSGTMPPALQEHSSLVYGDLMCVFGGKDEQDNYCQSLYFLNLKSLKWFKFPQINNMIPRPRSGHSLSLLPNRKLLIMGGDKFDYAIPNDKELRTSEVDNGAGTIIYTLELSKLGEYCPGIFNIGTMDSLDNLQTPVNQNKSKFEEFRGKQNSILSPATPSDAVLHSFNGTYIETGSKLKPKSPPPQNSDLNAIPPRVLSLQSHGSSNYTNDLDQEAGSIDADQYVESLTKSDIKNYQADELRHLTDNEDSPIASFGNISPLPFINDKEIAVSDQKEKLVDNELQIKNDSYSENLETLSEPVRIISDNNEQSLLKELMLELKRLKEDTINSATEANKRITELEFENEELRQFSQLARLNNVVKHQAEIIERLQSEINYKDEYINLKAQYEVLSNKCNHLTEDSKMKDDFINNNILKYTESLDVLLKDLKNHQEAKINDATMQDGVVNELNEKLNSMTLENEKLAASRDKILKDYSQLKEDHKTLNSTLQSKILELSSMQNDYHSIMKSVQSSGKSLEKLQQEMKKLKQENTDLRSELDNHKPHEFEESSFSSINDAHNQLKINDLQAELIIIKEERDSLKDDVMTLKKKLLKYEGNF